MPVTLQNGKWKPVTNFPEPEKNICKPDDFLPFILEILAPYIRQN